MNYQANRDSGPRNDRKKTFFLKTLGCKVNQYESQAMREMLSASGFKECSKEASADIFIINTCTVTGQADKEARHLIARYHRTNPKAKLIVTGCYAQSDRDEIMALPGVTRVIGNLQKARIADILKGVRSGGAEQQLKVTDFKGRVKAFVKIQDGCKNFCSYCKVPLIRARLASKPVKDVVGEVRGLVERGFKEIVLTGICLGAWGEDIKQGAPKSLIDLLEEIERMEGHFRVRLSSIEPKYAGRKLIDHIAGSKKICKHLHIPLQSGDNAILKKMNRPYTAGKYLDIIDKLKARIKDIAITTDVMIGFPGETERNFRNTISLIEKICPLRTHIFTYSPREGTRAYDMDGLVDKPVLKRRYLDLKAKAWEASLNYRKMFLGRTLEVLVETKRDRPTGMLTGYSDNYIKVMLDGQDSLMGKIVRVKVDFVDLMSSICKL